MYRDENPDLIILDIMLPEWTVRMWRKQIRERRCAHSDVECKAETFDSFLFGIKSR